MKKLIALVLSLVMLLALTACSGGDTEEASEVPEVTEESEVSESSETPEVPNEFTVAAGDDLTYEKLTFDEDITIHLDPASTVDNRSQILFSECTFNGNITVIGDKSVPMPVLLLKQKPSVMCCA